jgi:glucosamine--fructose-6-phosphate aminotransferase (isomerizing)
MCSVVGYVGDKSSRFYVVEGLTRLEYRGYDSAGFVCFDKKNGQLQYLKATGGVENLVAKMDKMSIDGTIGLGHTRWATHGASTELNAHPHFNADKTISLVHNGIIENYADLKEQLQAAGHLFYSDTDTEVVAHVLEKEYGITQALCPMVVTTVHQLKGAYAFAALLQQHPETLIAVRKSSPLCIGIGEHEMFVASDAVAFADHVKKVLFLPDESFALIKKDSLELYDFSGKKIHQHIQALDACWDNCVKDGFEHFMLKEMYEQKRVLHDTVTYCRAMSQDTWSRCGLEKNIIVDLKHLTFLACGTSAHAAEIATFFFEQVALVQTSVALASEFRHKMLFVNPQTLFCGVSQSGETADTLEALRMMNGTNIPTLAVTNIASSTMVRESHGFLLTQAKKEVAVASTKSFTAQVGLLFWLAHRIALQKNLITEKELYAAEQDLLVVGEVLENCMERYKMEIAHQHAPYYAQFKNFVFLGRSVSFPFALEAALKLKEIAYCFVDCYPAGELKHGPIALIDDSVPVFIFSVLDEQVYKKITSAAQEVKARRGHLVVFAFEGQKELISLADTVFIIPKVNPLLAPLAMTGLMQLFMYHIAHVLGRPIDKPRNLAKSVTVE